MATPSYVAFHEAGHAVVSVLEYLGVDRVTIEPEGRSAGHAESDTFYMTEEQAADSGIIGWEQLRAEANARIALAGEIAQSIHDAASIDEEQLESDRHQVADCLLCLCSREDERDAYATLLRLQTANRLRARWDAVERVAALLLRENSIEGAAVREAIWPGISAFE